MSSSKSLNSVKNIEKDILAVNKKISELSLVLDKIQSSEKMTLELKSMLQINKSFAQDLKAQINKSKILETSSSLVKAIDDLNTKFSELSPKSRVVADFFEDFRTMRVYNVGDEGKIFRFLSGFLEGFSEVYDFKPEFVGVVDLNEFAKATSSQRDGAKIKVKYENLPKVIKKAYSLNLSSFTIEANKLKMSFAKDLKIKVTAESSIIKNIDRVAKDLELNYSG